jgi:NTP pyrophosphatase (non-canonical NTP hydrolase)
MITSENYVQEVLRTESCDFEKITERLKDQRTIRLLHAWMGLETEVGELMDALKKHIFYGKPLDWVNIKEELGDLEWYAGVLSDVSQVSLNEIFTRNIEKLRMRYPEKFTEEKALNRDLKGERDILESFDWQ